MPTFSAPGRAKRKYSRRNLPYMFLFLAIVFGFVALVGALTGWLSMAKESDLKFFAGSVERAPSWVHTKGGPIIRIRVEMDDGLHDLFEEDLSHSREIMNLKPGDHVTARVQSLLGEYHIWELKRDGVTIESYQDTYLYPRRKLERRTTKALWVGSNLFNISDGGHRSKNVFRCMAVFGCLRSSGRSRPCPAAEFRRLSAHLSQVSKHES